MVKATSITYGNEFVQPDYGKIAHWSVLSPRGARLPTLLGNCPTCNHECEVDITGIVVQGGTLAGAEEAGPPALTRQIVCNCRADHQQLVGVRGGCGRYWLAELSHQKDGTYHLGVQRNMHLLPTAVVRNDASLARDKQIKDTAERWIGVITGIYGLFFLAGIATAGNTISDLIIMSKSVVGAVLLLVALTSAGPTLFTGYLAAYSWPRLTQLENNADLVNWYSDHRHFSTIAAKRLKTNSAPYVRFTRYSSGGDVAIWFLPRHHS